MDVQVNKLSGPSVFDFAGTGGIHLWETCSLEFHQICSTEGS